MEFRFSLAGELIDQSIDTSSVFSKKTAKSTPFTHSNLSGFLSVSRITESYVSGVCRTRGSYCFIIPTKGVVHLNGNTLEASSQSLQLGMIRSESFTDYCVMSPWSAYIITVDQTEFNHRCEILLGKELADIEQRGFVYMKNRTRKQILLAKLRDILKKPKLAHIDESALADDLLTTFIQSLLLYIKNEQSLVYCNYIAVQVHSYLLKHAHEPLSMDQICEANGAKRRSIQKGFKDLYGMGPIKYHKLFRLHQVKKYLQQGVIFSDVFWGVIFSDVFEIIVSITIRWGCFSTVRCGRDVHAPVFTKHREKSHPLQQNGLMNTRLVDLIGMYGFYHSGRFSEYYKRTFGILPSQ